MAEVVNQQDAIRAGESMSPASVGRSGTTCIYGYLKNPSLVDYPGHMAAVFFTSGCNFRCGFCHNAELMARPQAGLSWERVRAACGAFQGNWVAACVVTGGEPTLHADLPDLLRHFKSLGWKIKLDTNGSMPEALETALPLVDYVAMDIKASLAGYPGLTGFGEVERIRRSVEFIMERASDYEFRTTIISGFHTDLEMAGIGELIHGAKRYILQPFVPRDTLPDPALRTHPRTLPRTLAHIMPILVPHVREVVIRGG